MLELVAWDVVRKVEPVRRYAEHSKEHRRRHPGARVETHDGRHPAPTASDTQTSAVAVGRR